MPSTTIEHPVKSGRPASSVIERLRAKIWYCAVKSCGNWSDYKLDMQFGQDEGPITKGGAGRNRVFGVIGNKGTLPTRGGHSRRKFNLVERVESHHQFRGTIKVIDSPFWELLRLPSQDLEKTNGFVTQCLELLNLTRLTGHTAQDWMWYAGGALFRPGRGSLKSIGASPYEASLTDATADLPCDLNLIALYGGLYREACLGFNPQNAEILGILFRTSLEQFCSQPWLETHGAYLENLAINRILYGKSEYIPAAPSPNNMPDLDSVELEIRGYLVSLGNQKLKDFMEHRREISMSLKCWMLACVSEEELDGRDWNVSLSDSERQLIRYLRNTYPMSD